MLPESLIFIPLVSKRESRYWSVRLVALGFGENMAKFDEDILEGTLIDSGSIFSYFNEDVLAAFYGFIPGAMNDNGVWTFPYPAHPRKIPRIFISFKCGLGDDDDRVVHHVLSLRQFVYEKGNIPPGDRVHGIFQSPGAHDSTVALLPKDFSMEIIGQVGPCKKFNLLARLTGYYFQVVLVPQTSLLLTNKARYRLWKASPR
ncbi:hypothetical protein B0H10DRAFT_659166 [Mycena sp. CBHHK59/15]|nr:hypothetical protein B0H10DRAFT_659166 [Mycena sp. CBHHK59/15]